jgi:glycerol-3-phosphate O-acyltransferase
VRRVDRERLLPDVVGRVVDGVPAGQRLDVVAQAAYLELKRLGRGATGDDEHAFWSEIKDELGKANERTTKEMLRRVARRYANEICGTFDERIYGAVTRGGEPVLGMLLTALSPKRLVQMASATAQGQWDRLPRLDGVIAVHGETASLHRLRERGTVILVPTHVSHMDSVSVGWALWKMKLPPFLYGAGLNLFSNPMLGFFLRNLGAYTVDRRKHDDIYKETLKSYATVTIENGYDNIFFPGGTRSRSGALEKKLKLGLLGTGIAAQRTMLARGTGKKVFVVPATLSFQLVLEAETLVDDFLAEEGKARYIITDDEASKPKRVFDFASQILSLDSKIQFTVGHAMDVFGNRVDDDGNSLDPNGRPIDASRFLMNAGGSDVTDDPIRDAEYTTEVGRKIVDAYAHDAIPQSTHIAAYALLSLLRQKNRGMDLMQLLRLGGLDDVSLHDLYREVDRIIAVLVAHQRAGRMRTTPVVTAAVDVVADALRYFSIYHTSPAFVRRGDRAAAVQRSLLFYYSNRLEGYGLTDGTGLVPALSPDHRTLNRGA